jgi:hypothetical protein
MQASKNIGKFMGSKSERMSVAKLSVVELSGKEKREDSFDLAAALENNEGIEFVGFQEISIGKIYGFNEIVKELKSLGGPSMVYPNFNYHLGLACREMGLIDEAIDQFKIAVQNGQRPFESAFLIGKCFLDKGCWDEARRSFEMALKIEGVSKEKTQTIIKELETIQEKQGGEEETLYFLDEGTSKRGQSKMKKKTDLNTWSNLDGEDEFLS